MSVPHSNLTKFLMVLSIVTSVATVAFAALWLSERVAKSAPVVKQVVKEVEVPAQLSPQQQAAIDFCDRFRNARFIATQDEALYKLDSVRVGVSVNNAIKRLVSEDRVKNKFELILRKNGIKIDERATVLLSLTIEGLWSDNGVFVVYTPRIQVKESLVIGRKGDLRQGIATLWEQGFYGFAGAQVAESAILKSVESLGEEFSNKYLAAQTRY